DLPRPLLALLPGPLLDLAHGGHRLALRVLDDLAHERLLGLLRGHPRDGLELRPMLLGSLLELLTNALELAVAVVELLAPGTDLLVRVAAHAADLLLDLDEGLADDLLRLLLGVEDDPLSPRLGALGLGLGDGRPHQEADDDSRRRRHDGCDRYVHVGGSSKRKCRTEARSGPCSAGSARVRSLRASSGPRPPSVSASSSFPTSFRSRCQALVEQSFPEWNLSNAQSTASMAMRQGRSPGGPRDATPPRPPAGPPADHQPGPA